jgi:hypothetical protein
LLDPGDLQELIHQREQVQPRLVEDLQALLLFAKQLLVAVHRHELGKSQDGVERRSQFMTDLGHEFALGLA